MLFILIRERFFEYVIFKFFVYIEKHIFQKCFEIIQESKRYSKWYTFFFWETSKRYNSAIKMFVLYLVAST